MTTEQNPILEKILKELEGLSLPIASEILEQAQQLIIQTAVLPSQQEE